MQVRIHLSIDQGAIYSQDAAEDTCRHLKPNRASFIFRGHGTAIAIEVVPPSPFDPPSGMMLTGIGRNPGIFVLLIDLQTRVGLNTRE